MKHTNVNFYATSKSRFYILFTFSFYLFVYFFIWNSWQPILIPIQKVYNWTLTDINLLLNLNTIIFVVFIVPFVIFWNKFGIKVSYNISAVCLLVGSFMRLYPASVHTQSIMIIIGSCVTAFGNLICGIGCTAISSLWFPSNERARSTTTALAFGALGSGISPLVATYVVPNVENSIGNSSYVELEVIKNNITNLMYIHGTLTLFTVIFMMIYFPSRPTILPCKSSDRNLRIDLIPGVKQLIRNRQFGLVFGMNFIGAGLHSGMFAVLTSTIIPLGVSQNEAALIKSMSTLIIFATTLISGWLCDRLGYKVVVFATVPPTIIMSAIFGLQTIGVIGHGLVSIYVVIGILSFVSAIIAPISYEMGCEAAFPVGEEVSSAVIGVASNIATMVFLFVTMIPGIGTKWVPWSFAACSLFQLPIIYAYTDPRKRLECDKEGNICAEAHLDMRLKQ